MKQQKYVHVTKNSKIKDAAIVQRAKTAGFISSKRKEKVTLSKKKLHKIFSIRIFLKIQKDFQTAVF